MEELSETFLYIALEKWLGRLLEESGKVVPAAAAAARATECNAATREAPASQRSTEEHPGSDEVHPSALLQHLPGGPLAVKSVLLAKHRARSMKLQADLMRLCCGQRGLEKARASSATASTSLLDEVHSPAVGDELAVSFSLFLFLTGGCYIFHAKTSGARRPSQVKVLLQDLQRGRADPQAVACPKLVM